MKTIMPSASAGSQNLPTRLIDFFFPPSQRKGKTQISVTSAGSSEAGERTLNTLRYPPNLTFGSIRLKTGQKAQLLLLVPVR